MKKLLISLLIVISTMFAYFYLNQKNQIPSVPNDCITLILPVFEINQTKIDEYSTESINLCREDSYLIDYSNISELKHDVKRFEIQYSPESINNIVVTKEEEWINGRPNGNFLDSQEKIFSQGSAKCFHAISPILMDVMVDYCFYEVSPNTLELKIRYESTFPI